MLVYTWVPMIDTSSSIEIMEVKWYGRVEKGRSYSEMQLSDTNTFEFNR